MNDSREALDASALLKSTELREHLQTTLNDVAYLARSSNRVRILDSIAGSPKSTQELAAEIGMSRATLGRILQELVDRGWTERRGRAYATTPLGAFVINEFTALLERLNTIRVLNRTARWFPEEHFDFDLHSLATAEVVTTTRTDVLAPMTYVAKQIRNSDRVTILSHAMLTNCIEAVFQGTEVGQRVDITITPAVVAAIQDDDELASMVNGLLENDQVVISQYDGTIPFVFAITDDEVNLLLFDDEGAPHALICTDDSAVLSWAESTFATYASTSTSLEASQIPT